jgi:hypothetical protein
LTTFLRDKSLKRNIVNRKAELTEIFLRQLGHLYLKTLKTRRFPHPSRKGVGFVGITLSSSYLKITPNTCNVKQLRNPATVLPGPAMTAIPRDLRSRRGFRATVSTEKKTLHASGWENRLRNYSEL